MNGAQSHAMGNDALILRIPAVPMRVMFEESNHRKVEVKTLSFDEIDRVVQYMKDGMHDHGAAKQARGRVKSPHWWDDQNLITGKFTKNEFVVRVMDHMADQHELVGSNPPTCNFPRSGIGSKTDTPLNIQEFRKLSAGLQTQDVEERMTDEEMSESDTEESYTAIRSVVTVGTAAAQEARESPRVYALRGRLVKNYWRLFSGVANKNPPDRGRLGTARKKLRPNPKVSEHRGYQLQGERKEAMKMLLKEFIERGCIEPLDSQWASPAFIVPKKEKGEWRLVVEHRGLNEQTEHDSYSLPFIDTILQTQARQHIFTLLHLKHGHHQMPLQEDSRACTARSTPLCPMQWKVVLMRTKKGNAVLQRMMEDLLGPVIDCADPFPDEIIIGSGTVDMSEDEFVKAHETDLRRVLTSLIASKWYAS